MIFASQLPIWWCDIWQLFVWNAWRKNQKNKGQIYIYTHIYMWGCGGKVDRVCFLTPVGKPTDKWNYSVWPLARNWPLLANAYSWKTACLLIWRYQEDKTVGSVKVSIACIWSISVPVYSQEFFKSTSDPILHLI